MELRPGYKKTEIGVIPEDWDVQPLGKCLLKRPSYGINAPAVPFSDRLPVYIRITDITEDGRFLPHPRVSVQSEMSSRYLLELGDIVFARTGASVGKSYRYRPEDGQLVYAGFLIRIRPNPDRLLPDFASAYVTTGRYWQWVSLMSMRSGQPGINGNEYAQLLVPIPSHTEQKGIAEALSDVDASIAGLTQLIAKKWDLRQGAMQRLLTGQTRLPGFTAPWQEKRLGELGSWRGGMTPSMQIAQYWEGGSFPWLSSGDVKSPILHDSGMHITELAIASKATTVVPAGSIIFVMRSGILRKYFPVASIERSMAINQDIKALTVAADYNPTFIRQMLHWRGDNVLQSCLKTGTTVESIDFGWLKAFELRLPSTKEEQSAIAQALSDLEGEIAALDARLEKTRALKLAMMQALLTGRVRLPVRGEAASQSKEAAYA